MAIVQLGSKEIEKNDEEIKLKGSLVIEKLNKKYPKEEGIPRFNFLYRKRVWNTQEKCYLGWERKRGLLTEFNQYLIEYENRKPKQNNFIVNTIEDYKNTNKQKSLKIKYIITLDADTNLSLNSGIELIEAMSHPLNKPIMDEEQNKVIDGFGIMQPRVGIELEASMQSVFTEIFAGDRRSRFIYKCNFRYLSRQFWRRNLHRKRHI